MALRGFSTTFPGPVPTLNALIHAAEQLGRLPLQTEAQSAAVWRVTLAHQPRHHVQLCRESDGQWFVSTLDAPALYCLLWQVAYQAGGRNEAPPVSLRLPLTRFGVWRHQCADKLAGVLALLILVGGVIWLVLLLGRVSG